MIYIDTTLRLMNLNTLQKHLFNLYCGVPISSLTAELVTSNDYMLKDIYHIIDLLDKPVAGFEQDKIIKDIALVEEADSKFSIKIETI